MLVTFGEYERMGFSAVRKDEFVRFYTAAEAALKRFTFGRVTKDNITKEGRYALAEIIDVLSGDAKGGRLSGFSNEGYSESYSEKLTSATEKIEDIVNSYFGREDVCRGVCGKKGGTL